MIEERPEIIRWRRGEIVIPDPAALERNGVPLVAVPRRLGGGAPDRPLSTLLEGLGPTNPPSLTEPVPLEATLPPAGGVMNPV